MLLLIGLIRWCWIKKFLDTVVAHAKIAYTEHLNENGEIYVFKDRRLYGKDELWDYFLESLNFTSEDTVIIDRTLKIGKPLLLNKNDSRYISVIHSEHYSQKFTNDDYII